jgi:branched-subunit amino acid aminotransferase/4-amino-4-deoxychorismate lyase
VDIDRVRRALEATLAAPRDVHEVAVRITLTAGPVATPDADAAWPPAPEGRPTLVVTLHPAPRLPLPPARAVTTSARRWPADVKSTSYVASLLATREARAAGADIAVLVDGDELLETAEGNLFALVDGTLVTPPDDGRLLPGITRGVVLEAAAELAIPTATVPLRRADARRAEAFATSSSVAGLRTILRIDDMTPMITDREHPALKEAAEAATRELDIPVAGVDLMVPDLEAERHWIVEVNERPGLANHEPQPTAERFVDLLFPRTAALETPR